MARSKYELIKELYIELVKHINNNIDAKYDRHEKDIVNKCGAFQFYKNVFELVDEFKKIMHKKMQTVRAARLCDLEDYLYDYAIDENDTGEDPDCELTPFEKELFEYFSYDYYEKRDADNHYEMNKLLSRYANKVMNQYPKNNYAKSIAIALNQNLIKPAEYKKDYKKLLIKLKINKNTIENNIADKEQE